MPLENAFSGAGVFKPQDIAILHEVLQVMAHDKDTDVDRHSRAAALVRLYQSGVHTREALL